jgi:hypothetical protein
MNVLYIFRYFNTYRKNAEITLTSVTIVVGTKRCDVLFRKTLI